MIERVIELSIRHRAIVIAAAVVLAAWGTYEAIRTPIDAIPDLSENQVIVFALWPGHSPREVEDQVTYPLSLRLQGVRGVRVVRSSSDVGMATANVIFEDAVRVAEARRRVADRLGEASAEGLPAGVVPRLGPDAAATGQIFWYTVEGPGYDPGRLRAIQDWYVKSQLASVPGVAEVASVGGAPIEYQVNVHPDRLRSRGVSLLDVSRAVERANGSSGGHVVQKGNAEYLVRSVGAIGWGREDVFDSTQALRDLEAAVFAAPDGALVRVGDVAAVAIGARSRRGVLEKDGSEVTGGVVLMTHGENPLEVTQRIKAKLHELQAGLPKGVKILPFYDRTPLIRGAVATVTRAVAEAIVTATLCVLVVLLHVRASFVIAVTLPLAVLGSVALMGLLRRLGVADVETNAMSLAGIAISVGVLVDSSIVMTENAMHALHERFGDEPVRGDVREILLPSCRLVGRPIFFSVVIMLLSFLPVFALGGMEGKMFRPLAITKSFALLSVAVLAITLVPALCTVFLKGRIRGELESWLVRSVVEVYRPVLGSLLDRPTPLAWVLGVTFAAGFAPLGYRPVFLGAVFLGMVAVGATARTWRGGALGVGSLLLIALILDLTMKPLPRAFLTPLDEGMVMDMPITAPRMSVTQSTDDLKARDMVLCHFPEVDMVVGKAGRAETPTDPAPIDMIESMVNLRPFAHWPRRVLREADARGQTAAVLKAMEAAKLVTVSSGSARNALIDQTVEAILPVFDVFLREYAYQRNREFERSGAGRPLDPDDPGFEALQERWRAHIQRVDAELRPRAAGTFTRLALEELLTRAEHADEETLRAVRALRELRARGPRQVVRGGPSEHHHAATPAAWLDLEPRPKLDAIQDTLCRAFERGLSLWRRARSELIGFDGELDRAVQMPGWTNVWTMPIQNRIDMLSTGVNTSVGVRVLGRRLEDVVQASEAVADALKHVPGAADVVSDPVRGKGYLEVRINREQAARRGVDVAALNEVVETAVGGKDVSTVLQGRERHPVRVRQARDFREDEQSLRDTLVPAFGGELVPLAEVAEVRVAEGPATIKSENGLLRNYVRMNVRGRDVGGFLADGRRVLESVALPEGVYLEWTGQFEHEARARRTLLGIVPLVLLLIFAILYWTYHDLADASLMVLCVPGTIAGGVLMQWLWGEPFTVTVWIGYIACFGMATATGIIMLVYLRDAIAKAGGIECLDQDELRRAVLNGAVQRLRPKLLTEGTVLLGLAPMLWASGVGAEVIRPMAAPVLGGILVADEVIDLLLPVAFYHVRRRRLTKVPPNGPANGLA